MDGFANFHDVHETSMVFRGSNIGMRETLFEIVHNNLLPKFFVGSSQVDTSSQAATWPFGIDLQKFRLETVDTCCCSNCILKYGLCGVDVDVNVIVSAHVELGR